MKKSELKNIIKPIVEECVREVLLKEGTLSGIISEVVRGIDIATKNKQLFVESAEPASEPTQEEYYEEAQFIESASREKLQETRNKMMDAIGKDSYNGVNLFENTSPLRSAGNPTGRPSAPHSPLQDRDPGDAGVDISSFGSSAKKWSSLLK